MVIFWSIQTVIFALEGVPWVGPLFLPTVHLGSHTTPSIPIPLEAKMKGFGNCRALLDVGRRSKPFLQIWVHHFLDIGDLIHDHRVESH